LEPSAETLNGLFFISTKTANEILSLSPTKAFAGTHRHKKTCRLAPSRPAQDKEGLVEALEQIAARKPDTSPIEYGANRTKGNADDEYSEGFDCGKHSQRHHFAHIAEVALERYRQQATPDAEPRR
jgi:hypothetical protein